MTNYKKGSVSVFVLVVVLLALVAGGAFYAGTLGPKPGANAGPESTNEYFCNAGVCTWYKTVGCNTASSTMFSVANPFNATSTASIFMIGTGNATSTTFSVGTTTAAKSSGLALTDISASLVSGALVGTSSPQFTLISGITAPLGSGQISAGAGTINEIVVGPTSRVSGFATSTYGNAGAVGYTPSFTACRAVVEFHR